MNQQGNPSEIYAYDSCGYLTQQRQSPHGNLFAQVAQDKNRLIQNADIYKKGNQLNRLQDEHYSYDKAGRLIAKTQIKHGFRKQETTYRWNSHNQLTGLTNPRGEAWYYKYDGLGRRISKQCPEKQINIEYIWDGDQLAYTITERNGKLESERHSIFNGWELIAQQDYYSEFTQTPNGNKTEWKHQTHYAVTQPNGQVLSLFNPEGKTGWYKPQTTLWGLDLNFDRYASPKPLNPNLLFAGQYFNEESGLAYNRFRYYDPETASYLCTDPIGLEGGETPYSYVQNPWDWVDPFGLAGCRPQNAASNLPSLKGKSVPYIEKILSNHGFSRVNPNNISNRTWRHPDGSEVRVHQHGNARPSGYKSGNNAHIHKQDNLGNQLNDRGKISTNPNETHIGIKNPKNLPAIRNRPHGDGS